MGVDVVEPHHWNRSMFFELSTGCSVLEYGSGFANTPVDETCANTSQRSVAEVQAHGNDSRVF